MSPLSSHHQRHSAPITPMFLFNHQPPSTPSSPLNIPQLTHSTPYASTSYATTQKPSTLIGSKSRPKPCKKLSSSTNGKHRAVQNHLEGKVEKAKGFHAFFVPLARSLPPAPPSSPVLPPRQPLNGLDISNEDYFGAGWEKQNTAKRRDEEWVEDVSGEESMEVDSE